LLPPSPGVLFAPSTPTKRELLIPLTLLAWPVLDRELARRAFAEIRGGSRRRKPAGPILIPSASAPSRSGPHAEIV